MQTLERSALARVCGGEETTTSVAIGPVSVSTSQTNYKACTDKVAQLTAVQYPDTRLWIGPFAFGSDSNAALRAEATMRNMASTCGPPPP